MGTAGYVIGVMCDGRADKGRRWRRTAEMMKGTAEQMEMEMDGD